MFSLPYTICAKVLISGDTSTTAGVKTGSTKASASSRVRAEDPSKLKGGLTNSRLEPRDSILSVMLACEPLPMAMSVMKAATPMTIPSWVSPALSLLAPKDARAVVMMV